MTGDDHTDALIAALRSSPLPSERAGEDAAISAMLGAMASVPARPPRPRSRRSVAIAAVTVASLGVGGLVAAGPGAFFAPAADRSPDVRTPPDRGPSVDPTDDDVDETAHEEPDVPIDVDPPRPVTPGRPEPARPATSSTTSPAGGDRIGGVAATDACDETTLDEARLEETALGETTLDETTHGDVVSDEARSPEPRDVPGAARSGCGLPSAATGDTPSVTAPGRTGHDAAEPPLDPPAGPPPGTPAVTAPGRPGDASPDTPSDTPGRTATGDARP